jgi:transporter family protein
MWIFYALLSALFAALVAIFGKLGLKNIDSTLATTIRSIIMALFLLAVSFSFGKFRNFSLTDLSQKDWWLIVLAGIAGAVSWLFYFLALKNGPTASVVVIDRLSLVFVAILALTILKEPLSTRGLIGISLVVVGAILTSLK